MSPGTGISPAFNPTYCFLVTYVSNILQSKNVSAPSRLIQNQRNDNLTAIGSFLFLVFIELRFRIAWA